MSAPEEGRTFSFSIIHLLPGLPFEIAVGIPFTRNQIIFGKNSLDRLRKQAEASPHDESAHITFAAHLLSDEPVSMAHAVEAVKHLSYALSLMSSDTENEANIQEKAMVHLFLGDAFWETPGLCWTSGKKRTATGSSPLHAILSPRRTVFQDGRRK